MQGISYQRIIDFCRANFLWFFSTCIIFNNFYVLYLNHSQRPFNPDEYQHFHIAWNMLKGLFIYRDFFDHHGPLFAMLNGALLKTLENPLNIESLFFLRKISWFSTVLIAFVLFFVAKLFLKRTDLSLLTLAIFSMWNIVQNAAIEIRPDLLQSLFMLLGLYLFIKGQDSKKEKLFNFFAGVLWGLMLLFNFKSLIFLIGLCSWALLESYQSRSLKPLRCLLPIILGIGSVYLISSWYFYQNQSLSKFFYYSIAFNFDFVNHRHYVEMAQRMTVDSLLLKDMILVILFALSLFAIDYKDRKYRLLLISILFMSYGCISGLFPYYCVFFLPLVSVLIVVLVDRLLRFFRNRDQGLGLKQLLFCGALLIFITFPFSNFIQPLGDKDQQLQRQEKQINWMLKHVSLETQVAKVRHGCPAYIFSQDSNYYWMRLPFLSELTGNDLLGAGLVEDLENKRIPIISAYRGELNTLSKDVRDYILKNYKLKKINDKRNCIWLRKTKFASDQKQLDSMQGV